MRLRVLAALLTTYVVAAAQHLFFTSASTEHHSDVEITWHILKPVELAAPDLSQLHVPAGFRIQKFAENVGNARILAIEVESVEHSPLRPQMVVRALSDLIAPDAVISLDCGSNTFFSARHLRLRDGQSLTSPGMLATMAPGLPFAIAAQFAYPKRQSVAVVGDGGFAMLMAELTTAVQHDLPVKIVVLKNSILSEVRFEQQDLGNPPYGCELGPIVFVAFAKACGAEGFRCATSAEVRPAITAALRSSKAAVVEAIVDPDEPPAKPEDVRA